MTYGDFRRLTLAATEFADPDSYIAEEGGSVPTSIPDAQLTPLLTDIYAYAHDSTLSTLRALAGLSRAAFGREYNIPIRTLEAWEASGPANARQAPPYVLDLLAYAVLNRDRSAPMDKMIWIARSANDNTDVYRAFFDREKAEACARSMYDHLTPAERRTNTVSLEGYTVTVDIDATDPEKIVVDLLREYAFPADPDEYQQIR